MMWKASADENYDSDESPNLLGDNHTTIAGSLKKARETYKMNQSLLKQTYPQSYT